MSKIGVVTFANTLDNYGQVLQYLATQEYLSEFGHDVYLLNPYGHRKSFLNKVRNRLSRIFKAITTQSVKCDGETLSEKDSEKQKIFKKWGEITNRNEQLHPRNFSEFRKKYFNNLEGYYEDINGVGFNAICVGSDQTWSGCDELYFLGWVGAAKRFCIAPSVGHKNFTEEEIKIIKPWIQNFDFITVREHSGIELCNKCERKDAIKVLDPTFLMKAEDYNKYASPPKYNKPYIFIYMLGGEISIPINDIISFCESHGYDVKYVESQGRDENVDKEFATVEEWLGLISYASYVITNSFHGMALSIIYHKPYIIIPLVGIMGDMNGRIKDLSEELDLNNQIFFNDLNVIFNRIDWQTVDRKVEQNRESLNSLIEKI